MIYLVFVVLDVLGCKQKIVDVASGRPLILCRLEFIITCTCCCMNVHGVKMRKMRKVRKLSCRAPKASQPHFCLRHIYSQNKPPSFQKLKNLRIIVWTWDSQSPPSCSALRVFMRSSFLSSRLAANPQHFQPDIAQPQSLIAGHRTSKCHSTLVLWTCDHRTSFQQESTQLLQSSWVAYCLFIVSFVVPFNCVVAFQSCLRFLSTTSFSACGFCLMFFVFLSIRFFSYFVFAILRWHFLSLLHGAFWCRHGRIGVMTVWILICLGR